MGLGKKEKKAKDSGKKESKWVNVGSVCTGQEGGLYIKASSYKGRLLWQAYGGEEGDDKENSTFHEIHTVSIFEPNEKAPDFVEQTLSVNLLNPKQAEQAD